MPSHVTDTADRRRIPAGVRSLTRVLAGVRVSLGRRRHPAALKTESLVQSEPQIQLEALHELARAVASGEFRARTILERACSVVAKGFDFDRVGIIRYFPETDGLAPFAVHGMSSDELGSIPPTMPLSSSEAFQRAITEGRALFVADAIEEQALPAAVAEGMGITSFVVVPLVSEGRCRGLMTCDRRGRRFTLAGSELQLLTTIGTLTAAFLEKAIQHSELRRLNELKSQFTALASHELRTPVAVIYGVVRTLEERADELSPGRRAELQRVLSMQVRRLYDLVENLLDLSRFEADALRIAPAPIAVRERLTALIEDLPEGGEGVELDASADVEAIVDPHAFDRIVANLLSNAVRHGAPPVTVAVAVEDGRLRVTVEDQGAGVAPDFVTSLFERFTRGSSPSGQGAGLGLSITQAFARAHGGTITFEPVEPHGARFRLELPAG
jgi:signal transduction histidine kinase